MSRNENHIPECDWHQQHEGECHAYPTHTAEDLPQKTTYRLCAAHATRYVELGCGNITLGVTLYPSEILARRIVQAREQTNRSGSLPPGGVILTFAEAEEILVSMAEAGKYTGYLAAHGFGRMITPPWYAALEKEKEEE